MSEESAAYDPSANTVASVLEHVGKHPELAPAVLKAEQKGKNRSSLLTGLEYIISSADPPNGGSTATADIVDSDLGAAPADDVEAPVEEPVPVEEPEVTLTAVDEPDPEPEPAQPFARPHLKRLDSDHDPRGRGGTNVADLQRLLGGVNPTGKFSDTTALRLKRFQAEHGLEVTGEADAATWYALEGWAD